ncbi:type II glyceraldehyde-3-phosphate dehydrogenase [Methanimicrococcus blatticola]|nr:type II glyceraldehyde-3-phosphate dehydrogenase [Methanimicrococcus blatticola]MBZ3934887.1 type II glyceraldehyde-3-phosphate dehydrogenase [Methanimicrococcus blatticola]MCC2509014.1 type II glyceraldehyde-3-phosphate dehydrogenase [Methanimicrococcus blatticola]
MSKVKVAINGYGTIGKRVADAVALQDDMEIIGISKTRPNFEAKTAAMKGYNIYAPADKIDSFKNDGYTIAGSIEDMVKAADIVVDCTPGKIGVSNKALYEKEGVKAIWQGGESKDIAPISFNSEANYADAIGADYVRVVSCNTTGLCRVIYPLDQKYGVEKVRVTIVRRGGDPGDIKSGPIDALVLDPIKLPSHHGPDVKTIMPHINITSAAIKAPTSFMHLHVLNIQLKTECSAEDVKNLFASRPRIRMIADGISATAQIIEFGRDLGRPRNDMWENCVFRDSVSVDDGELYFFQAIHQESDVIPENVDAIRAMMSLEKDNLKSIEKTNKSMGIGFKC